MISTKNLDAAMETWSSARGRDRVLAKIEVERELSTLMADELRSRGIEAEVDVASHVVVYAERAVCDRAERLLSAYGLTKIDSGVDEDSGAWVRLVWPSNA